MRCKKKSLLINLESKNEANTRDAVSTRSILLSDGKHYLITVKNRLWEWYDELGQRNPKIQGKIIMDLHHLAKDNAKRSGKSLHSEITFSFKWFVTRFNARELERRSNFLTHQ